MRAVVQRVRRADVAVGDTTIGAIGVGLVVLLCVASGDGEADSVAMASKIAGLRIFPDIEGKMNRSVRDAEGSVLLVSQFTLCADVRKGRRPSFVGAADPERAASLIEAVSQALTAEGVPVFTGQFGERMLVSLTNEGPVTIVIDVQDGKVQ